MELSLFSRDVIALSTAVALSHQMFDAAVYLGICDKIVPGLLIGALSFGHLPAVFIPAGPMPSGLANDEKSKIRQLYAEGKATRAELLEAEAQSYHGPGTCTFYGTANTNQMLMEIMGLHLPGASFVNPEHAAARCADRARRQAGAGDHRARQRSSRRSAMSSTSARSSTASSACTPPAARPTSRIHLIAMAARGGHRADLGRFRRSRRSDAAADAHLSERQGRREPFPGRRRHAAC